MYFKYFKNTHINHITEYFDLQFIIHLIYIYVNYTHTAMRLKLITIDDILYAKWNSNKIAAMKEMSKHLRSWKELVLVEIWSLCTAEWTTKFWGPGALTEFLLPKKGAFAGNWTFYQSGWQYGLFL